MYIYICIMHVYIFVCMYVCMLYVIVNTVSYIHSICRICTIRVSSSS